MINLSFAGCGFLGIYHVGVASCFREYAPHVLVSRIAGASVGSIAAAALICDLSLGETTSAILSVAREARHHSLGPLSPRFNLNTVLKTRLEGALPPNAHQLCTGRLFISVTRWRDMKNVLLSEFNTRQELIQAILCSCFIPYYSGYAKPVFQGEEYVDGGLSDNLPVLNENTVTVSPFAGEHDICPQDESCNILQVNLVNTSIALSPRNIYRLARILFPPEPAVLNKMCQQGFDDALKFLQRKNIITCTRCLGIQSTVQFRRPDSENCQVEGCGECKKKRNLAKVGSLPISVVDAIQSACDEVNKGVYNWIFRRRPMKFLSLLALPYTLPLDITIVIFAKVWEQLPSLRKEMLLKFNAIIDLIKLTLKRFNDQQSYSARFSCELAVTEFDYTPESTSKPYSKQPVTPPDSCPIDLPQTETDSTPQKKQPDLRRMQRKSYAGLHTTVRAPPVRRKSLSEVTHPERVIRNMRFGFTIGMSESDRDRDFFQSLKSLGEEDHQVNIVDLTNKALQLEHEYINRYLQLQSEDCLTTPDHAPVMSYSYMDEDKTVKMTEIYKVSDADSSRVLSEEERRVNSHLEWESNWIDPPESRMRSNVCIADGLEDDEFNTSDNECDLTADSRSDDDLEAVTVLSQEPATVLLRESETVLPQEAVLKREAVNVWLQNDVTVMPQESMTVMPQKSMTVLSQEAETVMSHDDGYTNSKPNRKTSFVIVE